VITVTIDGIQVSVEPGTTIMQAAEKIGIFIPHYCYHQALSIVGSCRLCLVTVEGSPKEVVACGTPCTDKMIVYTQSERVKRSREIVLEFLLLNHPLDCPVCDKAGECLLQDYSFAYGTPHSRFKEPKRVPPFKNLGPNIKLATTRCILCTRCVRFMNEIANDAQLAVINRGSQNEIDVAETGTLDHPLAGNVVDICPVGALLDKNFIHRTRVWHLSHTSSVCAECGSGCNVRIDSYKNEIFRIAPRFNEEVNSYWMCDTGRYAYKKYAVVNRLTNPLCKINGALKPVDWNTALQMAADGIKKYSEKQGACAGLITLGASNEDTFLVKYFLETVSRSNVAYGLYQLTTEEDIQFESGFFINNSDKYPNLNGVSFVLDFFEPDFYAKILISRIESGEVSVVYCLHTDLLEIPQKVLDALKKVPLLIVEDITESPLAQIATIVLPGRIHYEKTGTFINCEGQVQRFLQAVQGPKDSKTTLDIMKQLSERLDYRIPWQSSAEVFVELAKRYSELSECTYYTLGDAGKPIF